MKALVFLSILCAMSSLEAQPIDSAAAAILRMSEFKVMKSDRRADSLNGTFHVSVSFTSDVIGKESRAKSAYLVTIERGDHAGIEPIGKPTASDSTASNLMRREAASHLDKSGIRIFNSAFPWKPIIARSNGNYKFASEVSSDSTVIYGKSCYLIEFSLDAEGDSMNAQGGGKIWIERSSLLPVRTYDDLVVSTSRGKAEVIAFSDFRLLPKGIPVLVKSEIRTVPKFLFVKVGLIRVIIEQSDFNLE